MFPSSWGIELVNRFPSRELPQKHSENERKKDYMLTRFKEPHSGGIVPLR